MSVPMVSVRHKVTGTKTFLPETALNFLTDYERTPSQRARDEVPDGSAFPGQDIDPDVDQDGDTAATDEAPKSAKRTTKS